MKKIVVTSICCLSLLCCSERREPGSFKVSGEIRNVNDQKIFLDHLYFTQQNPETIDTSEVRKGKFQLSAIGEEEGLYRIRLEKNDAGFLFINDQPEISFTGDINDISNQGHTFNTPANIRLKNFLSQVNTLRNQLKETSDKLENLKATNNPVDSLYSELNKMVGDYNNYLLKFVDTVPDPIVAMFALGFGADIDPSKLTDAISRLPSRFPEHKGVAELVVRYNEMLANQKQSNFQKPGIGSFAPELTMADPEGKPFSLSSLKGKYVLVDFWASWCRPCRGENPNVVAAYNKFKGRNFTVLGVSLDEDKNKWLQAIAEDKLEWKQISDLKAWGSAAVGLYGFDGIPYNVLIDPSGKIIATELRDAMLHNALEELLK